LFHRYGNPDSRCGGKLVGELLGRSRAAAPVIEFGFDIALM
jgi:hypothetical protein